MNHKKLTVCKSNKVIEAAYKLSLNEQRLVLACIGQVDSKKPLSVTDRLELTAKDFSVLYGVVSDKAYQTLKEVAEQLFERYVIIDNPDPEYPTLKYTKTRWISAIDYIPDEGKVALYFSQRMLPYLSQLQGQFTQYKLEHIGKMTSIYGIRLYELLMQWQNVGKREVELDWLKKQFQLDSSYDRMDNFKARVLEPAIKDINEHSNFTVSWTQRKTGRRVTHLTFIFEDKAAATPEKPKAKRKKQFSAAEWTAYVEKNARVGESWEHASARLKDELDKKAAS